MIWQSDNSDYISSIAIFSDCKTYKSFTYKIVEILYKREINELGMDLFLQWQCRNNFRCWEQSNI